MRLTGSIIPPHLRRLDGAYRRFLPSWGRYFIWRGIPRHRMKRCYVIQARERGAYSSFWVVCFTGRRTRRHSHSMKAGSGGSPQK